jgi:flavodoxin
MGRMLIAFNSRTGNTRRLAEAVAAACGGELVEIREKGGPRSLPLTLLGALIGRRPALEPTGADPADFDVVAVGSPVWAGAPTPAARAFAAGLKGGRARFAAFATMGGAGGDKTAAKLAEAAGATPVATCLVTEKDLKSGAFEAEAKRFAEALTAAAEGRAP